MTNIEFRINQTVRNFGILAKVDRFHEVTGEPILRNFYHDGTYWLAKASACEPVDDTPANGVRHNAGLVSLG